MKTQPEFDFNKAGKLRDAGIEIALSHADNECPEWRERAFKFFKNCFLADHDGEFMAEDARAFAAYCDFPLPPSARAWGGIIKRAATEQLIKQIGFRKTKNTKAHRTPAALWIKII